MRQRLFSLLLAVFLLILGSNEVQAQLQWEHTFYEYALVADLATRGNTYVFNDYANGTYAFYNADYTPCCTLNVPPFQGIGTDHQLNWIEDILGVNGPDTLVEVCMLRDDNGSYTTQIVQDNGNVLLEVPNFYAMQLRWMNGNPYAFGLYGSQGSLRDSSAMFNLTTLQREKVWNTVYDVTPVSLDIQGDKWVALDVINNRITLFAPDFSTADTFDLTLPTGFGLAGVDHITETVFDSDPDLEFGIRYAQGFMGNVMVIDESSSVLFDRVGGSNTTLYASVANGPLDKMTVRDGTTFDIYSTAFLNLDQSYPTFIGSIVDFSNAGSKIYIYDFMNLEINLYNLDYTLWKNLDSGHSIGWNNS